MKYIRILINAVLSGLFIGLAGTVFLSVPNKFAGAFLFGFGLLTIVCYGFKLYTGAVGYLVNQGRNVLNYAGVLAVIWAGNWIGTWLVGASLRASRVGEALSRKAASLCAVKNADGWQSLLILGFFCGLLMYLGVESFRRKEEIPAPGRILLVLFCVMVFILSGFEHCIADMFYYSAAGAWDPESFKTILIITAGNSLGGFLLPAAEMVRRDPVQS